MAVTSTTSGSQWTIWQGVEDDVVAMLYTSGVGPASLKGFSGPNDAGSFAVLLEWKV